MLGPASAHTSHLTSIRAVHCWTTRLALSSLPVLDMTEENTPRTDTCCITGHHDGHTRARRRLAHPPIGHRVRRCGRRQNHGAHGYQRGALRPHAPSRLPDGELPEKAQAHAMPSE